ncbi:helix-turn-helix domain-containing protein [Cohnella herbarum]|uniref:Helix-turn-helix domain-containing protein n=1 Tax=Cohnella herbarum TaxID=2728023 RepID=A0A7Z2ZQJ0_9BACL|nr:helix-turn-helix domain-containing protein [Cohnella herbarum]
MKNDVKYLRRSKAFDMTQEELAQIIGVTKATISAIENGANTSAENMLKISRVFSKDPREIFFVEDVVSETTNELEIGMGGLHGTSN